jgi:hypothetical protein
MANEIEVPPNTDSRLTMKSLMLQSQSAKDKLDAGVLGRFFGSSDKLPLYIVAIIALFLLFAGTLYSVIPESSRSPSFTIGNMWSLIIPVITTIIGYLIGNKTSNDRNNKKD